LSGKEGKEGKEEELIRVSFERGEEKRREG
jgi:hypothetical protein